MKRIIYAALLAASLLTTAVSCTEDEVKPTMENGGGGDSGDKL